MEVENGAPKWKETILLERPIFHGTMMMGGRVWVTLEGYFTWLIDKLYPDHDLNVSMIPYMAGKKNSRQIK